MRYVAIALLALGLVACGSDDSPTVPPMVPAGTFSVASTSPAPNAALALPAAWPGDARVLAPTVTIQFTYPQSISTAIVIIDLMSGSNVCLQAEGLQQGPGYAILGEYVGGTTVTLTGNNFERNISYPLCGATSFATDHLRFRLFARYPPASPGGPLVNTPVLTEDVAMGWTFSK